MVAPVEQDARGIVAPARGLEKFSLDRHAPSPALARFVDRYWIVTWDLRGAPPFTQRVLSHPVANVVFGIDGAIVHGPATTITARTLSDRGRVLGVMFRPAGFRPFLGGAMSTITDRELPATDVLGDDAAALGDAVTADADQRELVAAAERLLLRVAPRDRQPSEDTTAIVDRVAADPTVARVDTLADAVGMSVRQLERRFADHVGVTPKAVIRRYRLYEAAERARRGDAPDWAGLAAVLGYSDQAHLTRDFTSAFGIPPNRYARQCAARTAAG